MSGGAARLLLLARVADLAGLAAWPPVGVLLDDASALALGHDAGAASLSERDLGRLRTWARRWQLVPPDVRAFYERNATSPVVGVALWAILDKRARPTGWRYGRLVQLWETQRGYRPQIELCPDIT